MTARPQPGTEVPVDLPPDLADRIAERVAERLAVQGRIMWSVHDVAFVLGVSVRTVWEWAAADAFPQPRQRGARTMWLAEEVRAWAKASPKYRGRRRA